MHRLRSPWPALLAALALTAGCAAGEQERPGVVDRETFVTTYVDLRSTALRSENGELDDDERAEVLRRNGVTEEQLLAFVEAWGGEVAYMREVWDEVEARLDAARMVPAEAEEERR